MPPPPRTVPEKREDIVGVIRENKSPTWTQKIIGQILEEDPADIATLINSPLDTDHNYLIHLITYHRWATLLEKYHQHINYRVKTKGQNNCFHTLCMSHTDIPHEMITHMQRVLDSHTDLLEAPNATNKTPERIEKETRLKLQIADIILQGQTRESRENEILELLEKNPTHQRALLQSSLPKLDGTYLAHWIVFYGWTRLLKQYGANIRLDGLDDREHSCLHELAEADPDDLTQEFIDVLKTYTLPMINRPNISGKPPLHYAVDWNNITACVILVDELGANIAEQNSKQRTAIEELLFDLSRESGTIPLSDPRIALLIDFAKREDIAVSEAVRESLTNPQARTAAEIIHICRTHEQQHPLFSLGSQKPQRLKSVDLSSDEETELTDPEDEQEEDVFLGTPPGAYTTISQLTTSRAKDQIVEIITNTGQHNPEAAIIKLFKQLERANIVELFQTPLPLDPPYLIHYAVSYGWTKLLADYGHMADYTVTDDIGQTCLHMLNEEFHATTVAKSIARYCKPAINKKDASGNTALHCAARRYDIKACIALADILGADINERNHERLSPFEHLVLELDTGTYGSTIKYNHPGITLVIDFAKRQDLELTPEFKSSIKNPQLQLMIALIETCRTHTKEETLGTKLGFKRKTHRRMDSMGELGKSPPREICSNIPHAGAALTPLEQTRLIGAIS